MSWPNEDECVRGVDLSYYQKDLNVADFVAKNSTVERYVLRAVWPNSSPDQAFLPLYDALSAKKQGVGAYFWPNPSKTLAQVETAWKTALAGREPAFVALDIEWSQVDWKNHGMTPIRSITDDTRETLRMADDMFGPEKVIIYAGGYNWAELVRQHGWEYQYKFWIPHYPTWWKAGPASWRQALDFEELEARLPYSGTYFPNTGDHIPKANVVGWQFSDHGRLPGYGNNLDLSLWLKPAGPTLEERVAALEEMAHSH